MTTLHFRAYFRSTLLGAVLAAGAACAPAVPAPTTAPAPARPTPVPAAPPAAPTPAAPPLPAATPGLPPIPKVAGPLAPDMVYPSEGQTIGVRTSTFVYGSVGNGAASLTINGHAVTVHPNGAFMAFIPVPADSAYTMHASLPTGESSVAVRRIHFPNRNAPRPAAELDTIGYPKLVTLANTNVDAVADTDAVTYVRPTPGGTYQWFLMPGTVVQATGKQGSWTRIRLDSQIEAWVEESGVAAYTPPAGTASHTDVPVRRISAARAAAFSGYSEISLTMSARTPFIVDQSGSRISLTVYNARANLDILRYDTNDPTVRLVRHEQIANDCVRFDVDLRHDAVGYLVYWRDNALVLRVRHLVAVDARAPLRGRVIAVDAGHPPAGSIGPTRLREPEATLAVAQQLKAMLEARGARVVMLRSTMDPVALGARPIEARRQNVEAFVSIHLNAFADGANPYAAARGSGTFFFHPQSEPLARFVQQGLVKYMGLRDEGINFNNLAVARPTWFPAVLCEGAWVVMPEQEAALRTVEFQRAYAQGILAGLEAYFASLAPRP